MPRLSWARTRRLSAIRRGFLVPGKSPHPPCAFPMARPNVLLRSVLSGLVDPWEALTARGSQPCLLPTPTATCSSASWPCRSTSSSRGALIAAIHAWVADKAKPLGQILRERGALADDEMRLVDVLVGKLRKRHGGDVRASLGAVGRRRGPRRHPPGRRPRGPPVAQLAAAGRRLRPGRDRSSSPTERRSRYTLTRLHAEGGLGQVWVARDAELNREVALKEIKPQQAGHPEMWRRFLKEAQVTGQLEHPNIVPVYELARRPEDGQPFYTMRFVQGRTLRQAIAEHHEERGGGRSTRWSGCGCCRRSWRSARRSAMRTRAGWCTAT